MTEIVTLTGTAADGASLSLDISYTPPNLADPADWSYGSHSSLAGVYIVTDDSEDGDGGAVATQTAFIANNETVRVSLDIYSLEGGRYRFNIGGQAGPWYSTAEPHGPDNITASAGGYIRIESDPFTVGAIPLDSIIVERVT